LTSIAARAVAAAKASSAAKSFFSMNAPWRLGCRGPLTRPQTGWAASQRT
jgi:hypothetical protein